MYVCFIISDRTEHEYKLLQEHVPKLINSTDHIVTINHSFLSS